MTLPTHALVLTAGLGTRLQPLTRVRAKPAVPVAGDPLIRRIVRWLAVRDVRDLVLNLHHLPATLTGVLGDGSDLGVRVRYSWEQPTVLGSAGGPRLALPLIDADPFLIVNGDTLADVDLPALHEAHRASGAIVTLAVTANREPLRYGGVTIDSRGRVTGFVPRGPSAAGSFHFVGVQIAGRRAFADVVPGHRASTVGGVYDQLIAAEPGSVRAFVSDGRFHDIGSIADYWTTSLALETTPGLDRWIGQRSRVHPSATLRQSILWDDVTIGEGCALDECIVTDGVRVPAGTAGRRSIFYLAGGALEIEPFTASP